LLILSDGVDLFGWRGQLREPLWQTLFLNRRPTEWLQWSALGSVFGGAWYLAADLRARGTSPPRRPLPAVVGLGAALMLIEDAGDVRHTIALYVRRAIGDDLMLGLHPVVLVDVPYFAVLALPLLYAAARYGRAVWDTPGARPYLVGAYGLYAIAAVGSALGGVGGGQHASSVYLGSVYERLGDVLVRVLPGGDGMAGRFEPAHFRFLLMDGPVEESLELLGASCMVGVVLACAHHAWGSTWRSSTGEVNGDRNR
jgi:hypothetical protein